MNGILMIQHGSTERGRHTTIGTSFLVFAFLFSVGGVCANLLIVFLERREILAGLRKFTLCTNVNNRRVKLG
jgi:hypothetical protein